MLTFLQLSDIHFRGGEGGEDDDGSLDYEFRELLIADARRAAEQAGGVSGLLICGDIANGGIGSQFGQAFEWLQNLCAAIDLDPWLVRVVPGNHDLQRELIGRHQRRLRRQLRECGADQLDLIFERILADPSRREALLEPLQNYLEFASAFNCSFGNPDPFWSEALALRNEHELVLRGINSSLICGPGDSHRDDRAKMVIGTRQATVEAVAGKVHYTLCHHPSSWLRDPPQVEQLLDESVHIRVTGHLHVRGLRETHCGVHLAAGAVSPSRHQGRFLEPCVPRYELISIRVVEIEQAPHLELFLRGRVWREAEGWQAEPEALARRYRLGGAEPGREIAAPSGLKAAKISRPRLELRYRLARLPAYDRDRCAQLIGAPLDQILAAPDHRTVAEIFAWAEAKDRLAGLWDAVFEAAEITPSENPFADG